MTPTLFRRLGAALLGPQWQRPLAAALTADGLTVSDRTVRRWAAGRSPVPEDVRVWLLGRLEAKVKADSKLWLEARAELRSGAGALVPSRPKEWAAEREAGEGGAGKAVTG